MTSIYIDMDDVLSKSNQTFLRILEREFGKKIHYSQITTFDLQESFDLSDNEYRHFFECIHKPDEMIQHTPVPGAREMLKLWNDKGYKIFILTGRPLDTMDISIEWLKRHEFVYDSFAIVDKYGRDASKGEKAMPLETLSKLSFDLAVEDSSKMAGFLSEKMGVTVALLDRPWNKSNVFNGNVHRCTDWTKIKQRFERL